MTNIEFDYGESTFRASGWYTPGDPGQVFGPPENCWKPYPAEFEFRTLEVEDAGTWIDARWALLTVLGDELERAACQAAEAQEQANDWRIDHE